MGWMSVCAYMYLYGVRGACLYGVYGVHVYRLCCMCTLFPIRTFRHASRTVKVKDDLVIPKGMRVLIPIIVLHHSKVFWENPEEFRPERCVVLYPSALLPLSNLFLFFQFVSVSLLKRKTNVLSFVTCLLGGGLVTALA